MNEWFIQKWRVKDLRLNRLITYKEGRESSHSTSWNRRPSLDIPRFPASSLGHYWRRGALSNGGSLSEVLTGVKERGTDHWPKKPYFRRFSASWLRKFGQGLQASTRRRTSLYRDPSKLQLWVMRFFMVERCMVGWKSMPDYRFSRKRENQFESSI